MRRRSPSSCAPTRTSWTSRIRERGKSTPWFRRRFDDRETHEVRLKIWGGDDSVIVRGNAGAEDPAQGRGRRRRRRVRGLFDGGPGPVLRRQRQVGRSPPSGAGGSTDGTTTSGSAATPTGIRPREWGTWWRPLAWLRHQRRPGRLHRRRRPSAPSTDSAGRRTPRTSARGWATPAAPRHSAPTSRANSIPRTRRTTGGSAAQASGIEVLRYYGLGNDTEPSGRR